MGIFDRLSTLIRSNISDLISRAENPEKMLNQLIVDMRGQLAKAKQQVASAIADKSAFETSDRMAEQIEHEERKPLAAAELSEDLSGDTLVKQFATLETRADADQQLADLKRKLGLLAPGQPADTKQLGKGAADAELVEDDDAGHAH